MGSRTTWGRLPILLGSNIRAIVCVVLVFALQTVAAAQSPSKLGTPKFNGAYAVRSEDDLLLLSMHLDGSSLSQGVNAYRYPGGVLVPLGEVCRLLEIAVSTVPQEGTASGYVRRQNLRFHLDVAANQARLGDKDLPFQSAAIEVHQSDIYIDAELLSGWFGLGLKVDAHDLDIQVKPLEPLPMQQRLQRERLSTVAGSAFSTYRDPRFPRVPNPYELLSGPAIDQTLALSMGPRGTGLTGRYTALVAADVEHEGLTGFLQLDSGRNSALTTLSVGQMDPEANLLGRFHAREYDIGQFYVPAVPLVSDNHLQSGFQVSSYPLDRSPLFSVTTFSGILLPGWDVQLYRGEALFDYQSSNSTGRYEFKNVPLAFGLNAYSLVFNGPGGERRQEVKTSNVGEDLVPAGQSWYRFAGDPSPSSASPVSGNADFGVTPNLSASVGFASTALADGLHHYGSAGLHAYASGVRGFVDFTVDAQSGAAQEFGVQWLWQQTSVEVTQRLVESMVSPVLNQDLISTAYKTTVQLGNLAMPKWSRLLPTDVTFSHEGNRVGDERWEVRDRLSYQYQGLGVTNWVDWRAQSGEQTTTQGQLLINQWSNGPQLTGSVNYSWSHAFGIDQIAMNVRKIFSNQRVLTYGIYETETSRNTGLTASLTRTLGTYSYGYNADVSTKGGLILGLTLSFGAVKKPGPGKWEKSAQSEATLGAVEVRVFLDSNGNGKYEPGELLLSDVGVLVNSLPFRKVTSKNGTVLVDGLIPFMPIDLQIAESTLTSPLWLSKRTGVRIVPRPGKVPVLDFPIECTGQVTGIVSEKLGVESVPRGGVTLELVDSKGLVFGTQVSAYDGFFTFLKVPVGHFTIRLAGTSPYHSAGTASEITIPLEGAYIDGVRVLVAPRSAKVPSQPE